MPGMTRGPSEQASGDMSALGQKLTSSRANGLSALCHSIKSGHLPLRLLATTGRRKFAVCSVVVGRWLS
jgi:hypothetical protein